MKTQLEIRASVEGEISLQQLALIHSKLEAEIHRFLVSIITNKQIKGEPCSVTHVVSQLPKKDGTLATPIA
jgi:hypothetical protein